MQTTSFQWSKAAGKSLNLRRRQSCGSSILAEAAASGATDPPEITTLDHYDLVTNDPEATRRIGNAFRHHFPADRVVEARPTTASEDFGSFGAEWNSPAVFWFVGGTDPDLYAKAKADGRLGELPTNHNPRFAPVIHPTLETGVETLVVATLVASKS